MNGFDAIPIALQPLLRRTYECESSYINAQKVECLNEMQEATDFVDKMRKKQAGLMASLKIVTGTTSGTDEIDRKIFALKFVLTLLLLLPKLNYFLKHIVRFKHF